MRATDGFGPKWSFAVQFNSTAAVIAAIPHAPPPDPTAPGPFSFAVPDRVRGILANAGFHSVAVNALDAPIGGADVDQTLNYLDCNRSERPPVRSIASKSTALISPKRSAEAR
jgi:hypothetical protein